MNDVKNACTQTPYGSRNPSITDVRNDEVNVNTDNPSLLGCISAIKNTTDTMSSQKLSEKGIQTLSYNDVHNHSFGPGYSYSQVYDITKTLSSNVEEQLRLFDEAGVNQIVWAPIPTAVVGNNDCCGNTDIMSELENKTYYLPDQIRDGKIPDLIDYNKITTETEQYYNTSVDWQVGKAYSELKIRDTENERRFNEGADKKKAQYQKYEKITDRIHPAITGINLNDSNAVVAMLRLKMEYPEIFHIIGEVTMHKEFVDKQNKNYSPAFDKTAPANAIFRFAGDSGMPVVLHCDSSDVKECLNLGTPGKGEYFSSIKEMISHHPQTTFIHAHMGGVGKYSPPDDNHVNVLRDMLNSHPEYYIDMSWDVVAENYSPVSSLKGDAKVNDELVREKRIKEMAQLINDFPERFIMGSDALISRTPESISRTYSLYSNYGSNSESIGQRKYGLFDYLRPDSMNKVLTENFDRILSKAKKDNDIFEKNKMKDYLKQMQAYTNVNKRVPNVWRQK